MTAPAQTPEPPYYAVIFTSLRAGRPQAAQPDAQPDQHEDAEAYAAMAARMFELAAQQPGFLGVETARGADPEALGVTVSYWRDLASIRAWKAHLDHREAQRLGRERWYASYRVRIARVERDYGP